MIRTNDEQRYHQCGQLTHFHCTIVRRGYPHLSGSHVSYVSLAYVGKFGNVPLHQIYTFTKFDGRRAYHFSSTSLKVPLSIHVILWYYTLDYSGRVYPCCCRLISVDTYAKRSMHALSTLELRGGPEHARAVCFTLMAPFVKHL